MSHAKLYPPDKIGPNPDQPRESFERKKQWRPERVARGVSDRARTERQYENRQGIGPRSAVAPRSLAVWMQGIRDRGRLTTARGGDRREVTPSPCDLFPRAWNYFWRQAPSRCALF